MLDGILPPTMPDRLGTFLTPPALSLARYAASLKSPLRIASDGTRDWRSPVARGARYASKAAKEEGLSRFLLKLVPGINTGPPIMAPGKKFLFSGFGCEFLLNDQSLAFIPKWRA